jgi:DNA-binding winged helix-turn-helix (wHTH) protein
MRPEVRSFAILRFDAFEVSLRAGELYKKGRKIKLQEQPFHILAMLLVQPGEVITREELREKLWPADTFVDFDHSLNTAIKKLRRALGDEADKPRFIETLPRRGYRFLGAVEEVSPALQPPNTSAPDLVGNVFLLCSETDSHFVLLPIDENALKEKQKVEAANDDLGLSLLSASGKLLLVLSGTKVRVLEPRQLPSSYEVRILDGEYTGETAVVQRRNLKGPC